MLVVCRHPEEVVVDGGEEVAATPDKDEDFFSSWDKPAIKRPTPPPSRTATPPVIGRTASPLNPQAAGNGAAGNGIARSKSPLTGTATPPAAPRTTTSSALRTKSGTTGPRKSGVLGAKKGKLGAKKLAGEIIDFDEAEKRAKEEADRIAKLGYDPDAEEDQKDKGKVVASTPTPASAAKGHQRNSSDTERLGLQMNRLGFGQVGGGAGAAAKAAPKKMGGFGSVGASAAQGMLITC